MSLPEEIRDFLIHHSTAVIGTMPSTDRYPYVTPVFYTVDSASHIFFISIESSQKLKNIARNPYVGLAITDESQLTTLLLKGTAKILDTVDVKKLNLLNSLSAISNTYSADSFPPVMQLDRGIVSMVEIRIFHYRLSRYPGREAKIFEGTIGEKE